MPAWTALVAGTTGATSKRLIEALLAEGWQVIGVARQQKMASTPRVRICSAHDQEKAG